MFAASAMGKPLINTSGPPVPVIAGAQDCVGAGEFIVFMKYGTRCEEVQDPHLYASNTKCVSHRKAYVTSYYLATK